MLSAFADRQTTLDLGDSAFKSVNAVDKKYIEKLKGATQIMLRKFDPARPIVMLARDMDVFTPPLRASGRQTINFPFSRLQYNDASTVAQWKTEVPPHAIVVDSKLHGSILDAIKKFDPTVETYLLQSKGRHPELLTNTGFSSLADDVEYFPKLTGRCSGFRPSGAAICRLKDIDKEDVKSPSAMAIELRQSIFRDMGLSDWHVWRYKTFTSVPQWDRIGITAPSRIQTYLERVRTERGKL